MKDSTSTNTRPSRPGGRGGSDLIKSFVHEADQRRAACRFARTGCTLTPQSPERRHFHLPAGPHEQLTVKDDRVEIRPGTVLSNQVEDAAAVVGGLFASKQPHYGRKLSLTPAMLPAATAAAASGMSANNKPVFTFTRRKLQMESVQAALSSPGSQSPQRAILGSPAAVAVVTSQQLGHRPKASNLAAKLDAILRSSPWMRRKVVLQPQKTTRGFPNASALRLLPSHPPPQPPSQPIQEDTTPTSNTNPTSSNHLAKHHRKTGFNINMKNPNETEKRILATFHRFVRMWRERKRRSEQAALNLVNGIGAAQQKHNVINGNSGRAGGKLRRELDAQSSNVASILSRRLIGEVPALKFFDEIDQNSAEPTITATSPARKVVSTKPGIDIPPNATPSANPRPLSISEIMTGAIRTSPQRRATPRGVCYTLDASGFRHVKMQSGVVKLAKTTNARPCQGRHKKREDTSMERAMSVSLRRKMARRVRVKRQTIGRLTDDFHRSRKQLTAKLEAQLALRQVEAERMFDKRLSLLLSSDTELPAHMAAKELTLARLRFKKANLQMSCQTLAVLGDALRRVEAAGEASGLEISLGEHRFLEMFRCAVEGDHALTPLLTDGIINQFTAEQRQKPLVAGLLGLLKRTEA